MRRRLVRLDIGVDRVAHRIAERFGERDVRFRSNVLIARSCEQIEERANVLERITSRAIALQGKRDFALSAAVEMLADQNDLLRRRQNAQLAAPPKLQGKLAEDLVAESVKGADDSVVQPDRSVDVNALLHLGGGALGEGDGEDLVRLRRRT